MSAHSRGVSNPGRTAQPNAPRSDPTASQSYFSTRRGAVLRAVAVILMAALVGGLAFDLAFSRLERPPEICAVPVDGRCGGAIPSSPRYTRRNGIDQASHAPM